LKINIIAMGGAIIALFGLAWPWWTITFLSTTMGFNLSYSNSIYPYGATTSIYGTPVTGLMHPWYGWAAFTLLMLGAILAIVFSGIPRARPILALSGTLALLSVIVFATGLQNDLSTTRDVSGFGLGLFSSGMYFSISYTTCISVGFWLTLAGAIIMLVSPLSKPKTTAPTAVTPPPPPTQQEPSTTPP
jgi:hypothetical protein